MSAAEVRRPERWPDAMERLMSQAGLGVPHGAEPGTALMPPEACRARGAVAVSIASHDLTLSQCSATVIRNPST